MNWALKKQVLPKGTAPRDQVIKLINNHMVQFSGKLREIPARDKKFYQHIKTSYIFQFSWTFSHTFDVFEFHSFNIFYLLLYPLLTTIAVHLNFVV